MKTLFALLLLTCSLGLHAQELPLRDPTRPADWAARETPGEADALRLEAIKRGPEGRPLATINGNNLHLGQEIRGLRLVRIGATSVLLEGAEGRQELRLTPGVQRPSAPGGK